MLRCLVTIAAVLLVQPALGQSATAAGTERVIAGKIDLVEGDARILDANGGERRPGPGDAVYSGDTIVTGGNGELHVGMEDGGYVGVRPDTRIRIVEYRAEGDADDRSVFSLLQGSFRSITGWIGKYAARNYQVRTPTVTIGVRGTDHEPHVIPEGSTLGEPGTYDKVNIGGTFMESPQGRVEIGANQAGFAPHGRAARPQVLARVPAFFHAARHENRFEGRHEAVRQRVDQLRAQRRQVIEERRRAPGKAPSTQRLPDGKTGFGNARPVEPGAMTGDRQRLFEQRRREREERRVAPESRRDAAATERKAAIDNRHRGASSDPKRRAEKAANENPERDRHETAEARGERRRNGLRRE